MACYHPIPAYRQANGTIILHKDAPDGLPLRLPCGGCLGCRQDKAQAWALRCQLELHDHLSTVFTTLTYSDENLPEHGVLPKPNDALPRWIKRLRKKTGKKIRFFASAEYGERTQRPHFHAVLYGLNLNDAHDIETTWGLGHAHTEPISPARIAYVAGYCQKKIGYKRDGHERVDRETGEIYQWQEPYIQMSRRPGIGATAKRHTNSWRMYAVKDGHKMAVPRFLHNAWKEQATPQEQEELLYDKYLLSLNRDKSTERLRAAEQIATARQALQAEKRKY